MLNFSPKTFTELLVPLYNKISDAFGGFGLHSCGDYSHLFTSLRDNVRNLRAIHINAGENSFKKAVEVFKGTDTVIIPRWVLNKTEKYVDRADFVRDILRNKTDDVSVFLQAHRLGDQGGVPEENENIMGYKIMSIIERYNQTGEVI